MTGVAGIALVMVLLFSFFWILEHWRSQNRCDYCGEINGHLESCPYNHHLLR